MEDGKHLQCPSFLWDLTKYRILYGTILHSKQKARNRKQALTVLEKKSKNRAIKREAPNVEILFNYLQHRKDIYK